MLCLAMAALPAACARRQMVKPPGNPEWGVRIVWYGHSCFSFEDSVERKFLVDPFDETVGYDIPWMKSDVLMVTHEHFDHDFIRRAERCEVVNTTGVITAAGVEIEGGLGFHDAEGGARHGVTRFYVWEMGGLRFAHLGDLGDPNLSEAQKEPLRNVDVLFIPVGGKTTLDGAAAAALVKELQPRLAVPMHYGNPRVRFFEFEPVESFLSHFDDVVPLADTDFLVRKDDLPAGLTIYVPALPPARR